MDVTDNDIIRPDGATSQCRGTRFLPAARRRPPVSMGTRARPLKELSFPRFKVRLHLLSARYPRLVRI